MYTYIYVLYAYTCACIFVVCGHVCTYVRMYICIFACECMYMY